MRLTRTGKYAVLAFPVAALMACSSSETTQTFTGAINPGNGLPFAQSGLILNASTIQDRPFEANTSEASWNTTTSSSRNNAANFTVVSTEEIRMVRGGQTWTFRNQGSPGSGQPDLWLADASQGDGPVTLSAIFGQGSASSSFQSIFFGEIRSLTAAQAGVTDSATDIFAISGFETDPSELGALSAAARYEGTVEMLARTGPGDATSGNILDGTFTIDVDFGAGPDAVSGSMTGDVDAEFGGDTLTLTLDGGTLAENENSFSSGFRRTGGGNTDITGFTGEAVRGTLYGEDGKEIGLLISGTATVSGSELATTGFGRGNKQ